MSCPRALVYCSRVVFGSTETAAPGALRRLPRRPGFQTRRHLTDRVNQRYGTANQPSPHLVGGTIVTPAPSENSEQKASAGKNSQEPDETENFKERRKVKPANELNAAQPEATLAKELSPAVLPDQTKKRAVSHPDATVPSSQRTNLPAPTGDVSPAATDSIEASPTIAIGDSLSDASAEQEKPPHLEAPPYVHHFDTYTLVQSLQDREAFTDPQSVTIMKAVRGLLSDNMQLAREGLVSKGDVEMDTYQFRAGSGELRTEIRKLRATSDERMRADRLHLQHDVDSLNQRITQESLTLKDELKGMFDDRKMAVQLERRNVDNRIQELGYKITVAMNSGMRNEIEGLRFTLTRSTVLTLAGVVLMSLAMLRLASHQREVAKRKETASIESRNGSAAAKDAGNPSGIERLPPGMDPRSEEMARRVQNGENPALVSLG